MSMLHFSSEYLLASHPALPLIPHILAGRALRRALHFATTTHAFQPSTGYLVYLSIGELKHHDAWLKARLVEQVAIVIQQHTHAPFVGYDGKGQFSFILAGTHPPQPTLAGLAQQLVATEFQVDENSVYASPAIGYVVLNTCASLDESIQQAQLALEKAEWHNDLQPIAFCPQTRARGSHTTDVGRATWLSRLHNWLNTPFQILATGLLGIIVPFLIYMALDRLGLDVTAGVYLGSVLILLITSYLIWYEGSLAIRSYQALAEPAAPYPRASAIIAAYLPNEAATILDTIKAFLAVAYPGQLEIILAYNTPHPLPVEKELHDLAAQDERLRLLRVERSTSKAQNVNAALAYVTGTFVGIFDADHHPAPDSFSRAWSWLSNGYDIVQGHCVIRNGSDTWVTRMVAVEFETIYAVAHPGRARLHDFGIFGGSNGYWKTEVLRSIRMRAGMLTEDIDASLRALLAGYKITSDPLLISYELAPLTLQALWNQRMRWAQGWLQVSLIHLWPALRSPLLSLRQKLGLCHLLIWRELYPWISIQIVTVIAFWIWHDGLERINLLIPIFVLTTILTFSSGPGQVIFAYLLGAPEIRRQTRWYLGYLIVAPLFYSALKNLISRVAIIKEMMHEQQWKITPRNVQPRVERMGDES